MPSPLDQMMQQSQGQGGGSPLDRMMQSQSSPLDQMMRKRTSGPVGMASYGTGQQGWKTAYEGVQRAWTPMRTAIGYLQVPQSAVMQSFERAPQAGEEYGQFAVPNPLTPVGRQQIGRAWSNAWQSARAGEMPPDYSARMMQAGQPWYLSLPLGLVADLATDPLTYVGIGPLKKMAQGLRMFSESKIPQIVRTTMQTHNLTQVGPDVANVAKWAAGHAYETVRAGQHPARVAELAPGRAMEAMRGVGTIAHRMDPATIRSFERFAVDLGSQVNPSGQIDALSPAAQAALRDMVSPAAQDAARTGESWIKLRSPFVPKAEVPIVRNPVGPAIRAALASPRLESVVGPASRLLSTSARGPGGTMAAEAVREAGTGAKQMMTEGIERIKAFGESVPSVSRAFIRRADEVRVQPVGSFAKDFGIYQQAPDILQQRMPGAALTMPHVSQAAEEVAHALGVPRQGGDFAILQRWEEPGVVPDLNKPQGLYLSPGGDFKSPHAENEGWIRHDFMNMTKNPLDVTDVPPTPIRKLTADSGAGVRAIRKLDETLFQRLADPTLLRAEWQQEGQRLLPGVDVSRFYDKQDMMEAVGASLARKAGYDAIIDRSLAYPEMAEIAILTPSGVKPARGMEDLFEQIPILANLSGHSRVWLADNLSSVKALPPQDVQLAIAQGITQAEKDAIADRFLKLSVIAEMSDRATAKAGITPATKARLLNLEMPPNMTVAQYDALLERVAKGPKVLWRDPGDLHVRLIPKIDLARKYEQFSRGFLDEQITKPELAGGVLKPEQVIEGYQAGVMPNQPAPLRDSLRAIIQRDVGPVDEAALEQAAKAIEAAPRAAMKEFRASQKPAFEAAMQQVKAAGLSPGQERREIAKVAAQFKAERPPAATRDWQLYLATHVDPARLPTVQSYIDHFTSRAGVNTIPGWIEFTDRSNPMKSILGIGPSVRGFEKYKSLETPTKAALAGYQAEMDMQGMLYGRYRASVYARSRKRLEDFMLGVGLPPDHPQAAGRVSLVELGKTKGLSPQQVAASFPELTQGDLRFLPDVAHLILGTREASFREPAIGWLWQLYHKGMATWKGGATVANNAWAMNNIQGMTVNNFIRGVRDPRMYLLGSAVAAEHPEWQRVLGEVARAAMPERIYKQGDTFFVRMPMGDMDFTSLHQAGIQYGIHSGWHTAALENAPRAAFLSKPPPAWLGPVPKVMTPAVLRRLNRLNPLSPGFAAYAGTVWLGEGSEEVYRHTLWFHQLLSGDGWAEASRIVRDTHGDYNEFSPLERTAKTFLFPFYKWMRFNSEFQIGMLLHEPGTAAIVPRLVNAMNYRFPAEQRIDRRFIQPWAQDTMTMQLTPAGDPSEPPYFGVIRLPVMDLHQLAEPYSLLGSLGPLKTPIEVYLNKSMFTGQPIDRAKEYAPRDIQWAFNDWKPAPWWAMHLPRWMYSEGHLMPGVDPETGNTILYMSATTRYQLEGYIPQIAQWDRWGLQPGQDPEKIMVHGVNKQNLLRWATGVTARTVDEEVRQQVLERQQTQVERGQERQLEQRGLLPTKPVLPRKPYIPRP